MHGLSKPAANIDAEALRAERNAINKRAQSLTAERADLAIKAVLGDGKANKRIEEIDADRDLCAARVETIEAALAAWRKQELQTSWRKHLPSLQRSFNSDLYGLYERWSYRLGRLIDLGPHRPKEQALNSMMFGRRSHDLIALKHALEEIERIEHDTARAVAERILPEARVPFHTAGDQADLNRARAEHAKLIELRTQHINEAVQELLAVCNLKRPPELNDAIAWARNRLEVSKS